MFTVEADVQSERDVRAISSETLLNVVGSLLGGRTGRPDDEHPLKPGPWGPVIRAAVDRVRFYGPQPEPWVVENREISLVSLERAIGRLRVDDELNPQPLPPRVAFVAALVQTVVSRAEFMQEIADSVTRDGEQRGIIIVGGYAARFADEFCGTNFHLVWPGPGPKPHWFPGTLDGIDLVVMASQFDQTAKATFNTSLQQSFVHAGATFLKTAVARF